MSDQITELKKIRILIQLFFVVGLLWSISSIYFSYKNHSLYSNDSVKSTDKPYSQIAIKLSEEKEFQKLLPLSKKRITENPYDYTAHIHYLDSLYFTFQYEKFIIDAEVFLKKYDGHILGSVVKVLKSNLAVSKQKVSK